MKTSSTTIMKSSFGIIAASALAFGAEHAQANSNLLGIDVSGYLGTINWSSVYSCGAQFAFAKATEGTYYQDPYFRINMANGKAAGLMMGAYHFARPDLNCPSTEADYFWNFAGPSIICDGHSLYPAVDFEVFNGAKCESNYTAWFNAWAADVKAKTPVFMHPVIYCNACSGACDLIKFDQPGGITLSAWIVNHNGLSVYNGGPWTSCTCCNAWVDGCGTGNWTYWQVSTGQICGITGNTGIDAYNGTLAQLKLYEGMCGQ